MKYLAVKNFERFQHYADRSPPWIKLYNSLLDDYAFLALTDSAKWQLIGLWLLASRHHNAIPYEADYLRHALHAKRLFLEELLAAEFVAVVEQDAIAGTSGGLADRQRKASPRARGRAVARVEESRVEERRGDETPPPSIEPNSNGKQPEPWQAQKDRDRTDRLNVQHVRTLITTYSPDRTYLQFPKEQWVLFSQSERDTISRLGGLAAIWNSPL